MKADLLKELYKQFWDERYEDWYNRYKETVARVEARRQTLPQNPLSVANDQELLDWLIAEKSGAGNGISNARLCMLGENNYKQLIADQSFLSALSAYMLNPTQQAFADFVQIGSTFLENLSRQNVAQGGKRQNNIYERYNRYASACNLKLTVVVDAARFDRLFSRLLARGIIDQLPEGRGEDWHSKNLWLTEQLSNALQFETNEVVQIDDYWRNIFVWYLYERYTTSPFQLKKQVVKYGPPGTGKTYVARREMQNAFLTWKEENEISVEESFSSHYCQFQFHPSFGYEDFIEGLRPIKDPNGSGVPHLGLKNGRFKEFCLLAGRWERDLVSEEIFPEDDSGKSYLDRPVTELEGAEGAKEKLLQKGDYWKMIFDLPSFAKSKCLEEVLPPYYVLIDEINRAELSRTFGEMMFCLEYRGFKGAVSTQYSELNEADDALLMQDGKALFFVPTNVYIMGTMNTIDRSVESFDFALRRRFRWENVGPDEGVLEASLKSQQGWLSDDERGRLIENWKSLNRIIEKDLGPDYQIGHAYLMNLKYDPEALEYKMTRLRNALWNDAIKPLLEEYVRGAYNKETDEDPLEKFGKEFGVRD